MLEQQLEKLIEAVTKKTAVDERIASALEALVDKPTFTIPDAKLQWSPELTEAKAAEDEAKIVKIAEIAETAEDETTEDESTEDEPEVAKKEAKLTEKQKADAKIDKEIAEDEAKDKAEAEKIKKAEAAAKRKATRLAKAKAEAKAAEDEAAQDAVAEDETVENTDITIAKLKKLAKQKISEGVLRSDIKQLITNADAESIPDLDQEGLNIVYKKLEKL